jgi:hypothetical protein
MKKAIEKRQKALAAKRKAEETAKELKDKLASMPNPDEVEQLKNDYAEVKKQMKELDEQRKTAELEKIEDEKERERAKLEQEFKKEREKFQAEMDGLKTEIAKFNEEKEKQVMLAKRYQEQALHGSIINAAATKAYNPQQVVRLISNEFVHDETDDRWYKEVYDKNGKLKELLSVEEAVEAFLNDPVNENLLKVDVKPGSDMPRGNRSDRDAGSAAGKEPTEEQYKWAARVGLNIDKKATAEEKAWLIDRFDRLHKRVKQE